MLVLQGKTVIFNPVLAATQIRQIYRRQVKESLPRATMVVQFFSHNRFVFFDVGSIFLRRKMTKGI